MFDEELFEERAAVMEFDGGMERKEAEAEAKRRASREAIERVEREAAEARKRPLVTTLSVAGTGLLLLKMLTGGKRR